MSLRVPTENETERLASLILADSSFARTRESGFGPLNTAAAGMTCPGWLFVLVRTGAFEGVVRELTFACQRGTMPEERFLASARNHESTISNAAERSVSSAISLRRSPKARTRRTRNHSPRRVMVSAGVANTNFFADGCDRMQLRLSCMFFIKRGFVPISVRITNVR